VILKNFQIDNRTGQLTIAKDAILDENHLNGENLYFSFEVNLLLFYCNVGWKKVELLGILSYLGII
jgi:hypothetical protein